MTIVGNLPSPQTPQAMLFVTVMYLVGIFVFALIVGNACDMITSMTMERNEIHTKVCTELWTLYLKYSSVKTFFRECFQHLTPCLELSIAKS